jgi:hypothetical protein
MIICKQRNYKVNNYVKINKIMVHNRYYLMMNRMLFILIHYIKWIIINYRHYFRQVILVSNFLVNKIKVNKINKFTINKMVWYRKMIWAWNNRQWYVVMVMDLVWHLMIIYYLCLRIKKLMKISRWEYYHQHMYNSDNVIIFLTFKNQRKYH